ncbi:MAG: SDR family oxidoreductase [Sphingopyxis sp.]|nr:SDR family oxidoreductase [Sphingopyxis sp.]
MTARFADKTLLITGAASGIGAAVARLAAAEGAASLVLIDRHGEGLAALAGDLDCAVIEAVGDVGDAAFWIGLEKRIADRVGHLDCAFAGAGIGHEMRPVAELDPASWSRVLAVNLTGAFLTLQSSLRVMRDGGALLLISSSTGVKASAGTAAYGTSKAALIHLARVAALEAAPRGIRVNCISPGGVETPLFRGNGFFDALIEKTGSERGAFDALAARTPLGRYATAAEAASLALFLLGDEAGQITGANLIADAGMTLL